eukprot:6461752-Amphidinium_carterae.1
MFLRLATELLDFVWGLDILDIASAPGCELSICPTCAKKHPEKYYLGATYYAGFAPCVNRWVQSPRHPSNLLAQAKQVSGNLTRPRGWEMWKGSTTMAWKKVLIVGALKLAMQLKTTKLSWKFLESKVVQKRCRCKGPAFRLTTVVVEKKRKHVDEKHRLSRSGRGSRGEKKKTLSRQTPYDQGFDFGAHDGIATQNF